MTDYLASIESIATEVVAKHAVEVDQLTVFPQAAVDALRDTGLLGLISAESAGGLGQGSYAAARVVERIARECASTAMVVCMHYTAAAVIEKHGSDEIRQQLARGEHLATLAFSETGSRSHFWAPQGTAVQDQEGIRLNAKKSWVTAAHHATVFVWSSMPVAGEGTSTIWLVPAGSSGIVRTAGGFDGLGLRGNDSTPVIAENVLIPAQAMLGEDGHGLAIMLETVLPLFSVLASATAIGLMEGATAAACNHVVNTRYDHLNSALSELPTIRAYLARMRIAADQARCLWLDTLQALESGREDAMLRVLECKAACAESATQVLDIAMRICGGAAFRREVGVERRFRDARAGTVMAPTTDQLYDFIGKAMCGLPVF